MHHDFFRLIFGGVFVCLFLLFFLCGVRVWGRRSGRGKVYSLELFLCTFWGCRGPFCVVKYSISCVWSEFRVRSLLPRFFGDQAAQNEAG